MKPGGRTAWMLRETRKRKKNIGLYIDGALNTKGSRAGVFLLSPEGFSIEYALRLSFPTTNNKAEYKAMLASLGLAKALKAKNFKIFSDSQLVVMQVTGKYEAKDEKMIRHLEIIRQMMRY